MSALGSLCSFGIRQLFEVGADALVATVEKHLTDHSKTVSNALKQAINKSWQAIGLALTTDSLFDRIFSSFQHEADFHALKKQIREFLNSTPAGFEVLSVQLKERAFNEWNQLKKAKKFLPHGLTVQGLARETATFARFSDPAAMITSAQKVAAGTADHFATEAPNLSQVLRLAPPGGSPLLVTGFLFFLRREIEQNAELSRGLTFDSLRQLTLSQERGFTLLDNRTSGILDQIKAFRRDGSLVRQER